MAQPIFSFSGPIDIVHITQHSVSEHSSQKKGAFTTTEDEDFLVTHFQITCSVGKVAKHEEIVITQIRTKDTEDDEYAFINSPDDIALQTTEILHDLIHETGHDCEGVDLEKPTINFMEFLYNYYSTTQQGNGIVETLNNVSAKDLGVDKKDLN